MNHAHELRGQDLEEVAEELWTLEEEGRLSLSNLRGATRVGDLEGTLRRMEARGLVRREGGRVTLTPGGRALALRQIRRHRLAELLLATVLEVEDDRTVDHTACVMEHVLGPAVTDSVCAFLGHPKFCPHGKPIPSGECCRTFSRSVEPAVEPLGRLAPGDSARITYIVPRDPARLARLSGLGVMPGVRVRLQQKKPAMVIVVGETTVAMEPDIASEIYVKRDDS